MRRKRVGRNEVRARVLAVHAAASASICYDSILCTTFRGHFLRCVDGAHFGIDGGQKRESTRMSNGSGDKTPTSARKDFLQAYFVSNQIYFFSWHIQLQYVGPLKLTSSQKSVHRSSQRSFRRHVSTLVIKSVLFTSLLLVSQFSPLPRCLSSRIYFLPTSYVNTCHPTFQYHIQFSRF